MTSNPDVPPFTGYVETTVNALRLIHAARQGVIPRITRRLNDSERRSMIKSGAVFVFSVEESGIKRWTDGLLWSPSRIVGNFLVYREINERTSSRGNNKKPYPTQAEDSTTRSMVRKSSPDQLAVGFKTHGGDQGTFKPGGLIKKTITVTIEGSDLHLISYYTSEDIRSGKLKRPSSRSDIMGLSMPPQLFRLTNFRVPPKVEMGPDQKLRLVEAEDHEPIDCKVEDQCYNIPSSPSSWSSHTGSPTSPVENPFGGGGSMYSLGSGQNNGGSTNGYARSHASDRWPAQSDSLGSSHRQDMSWSPSTSALSSAHTMGRRREGSILQSEGWGSIHSQSNGRWQGQAHETHSSSNIYPERPRARPSTSYDETHTIHGHRREPDTIPQQQQQQQSNFPLRYTSHTRESALQRLHWHPRDTADTASRDVRRNTTHASSSFSSSPTMPFSPQGYHTTPTYTSTWTSPDANMLSTPTLHPISTQSTLNYDGSYNSSNTITNTGEYAAVEDFHES